MENLNSTLININNCSIKNSKSILMENISWEMKKNQAWLITGPNGGGKAHFLNALIGNLEISPEISKDSSGISMYSNIFTDSKDSSSIEIVSLEKAATLIEEERNLDESEYMEGGIDIGRTGRIFIAEGIVGKIKKGKPVPEIVNKIEAFPAIKLCGVEKILDRGLKYMSTGEIRRTLLARALISNKKLLILSDPFAGLDVESRKILLDFFNTITSKQLSNNFENSGFPYVILCMERFNEIPEAITNVLEFADKKISFCGNRKDFEKIIEERNSENQKNRSENKKNFASELENLKQQDISLVNKNENSENQNKKPLIEMKNVNVGWNDKLVLKNLTWTLNKNEHWLIQGPNGCGKTTFLELITGDNQQVFCNDIKIFGARRGSGETIWDIKHKLGIVSYRLHVEYRMLKSVTLKEVIISGFHDSIGLYEQITDIKLQSALRWLKLGGFEGRENETFNSLSYGEQRAILIIRAAVKSPEILILDEPCHGLDENFRQKILDLLELVAESGTTTLLHVTHEESEVLPCEKHILQFCPNEEPMYKIISTK